MIPLCPRFVVTAKQSFSSGVQPLESLCRGENLMEILRRFSLPGKHKKQETAADTNQKLSNMFGLN